MVLMVVLLVSSTELYPFLDGLHRSNLYFLLCVIKQTSEEEDSASFDDRIVMFYDQSFDDVEHSLCDDEEVS